ncbi:small integral membrane protein 32-like [Hoplias malabaricus]|uniref:small integral membrane protein 32-like n=1 Tax=Hoplias malabaricus TaxID=27720 RepID=UPI00346376C7
MLRQVLLNSTAAMNHTHAPPPLGVSVHAPVSVSALLKPAGRGGGGGAGGGAGGGEGAAGGAGGLRELNKPDLATYVVMCLVLFLLVLLIVLFINCQLRNSFFASMPYDRSLREARSSYK